MITMNDFQAEPEALRRSEIAAAERVLQSGSFILGSEVRRFEATWAAFCGTPFAVGVASGMDALQIGIRALDIGPGDEVITTPMTAMATILAIYLAGAKPVLADIDPDTALLSPASAERRITPRTKAVLLVHLYGQVRCMEAWVGLCQERGIHLLEDCAQAHGARWEGKMAGTFGTWGAYSFYPTKNLGARGDAGALVTHSQALAQRARSLRNYGQTQRNLHAEPGVNSRLDELQAAILSARLEWLEPFNQRRRNIALAYASAVSNPRIQFLSPPVQPGNHVWHLFVVRTAERARLQTFLRGRNIETAIHYPIAAHRQPWSPGGQVEPEGLTQAEKHSQECLSIPCHPQMSDEDVRHIIEALNEFR